MSDPRERLSASAVGEAGLADWIHVDDTLAARFRSKTFAAGLELVNRIGAAAEAADHHPGISLTYAAVDVTLSSHDVGGITSRDIRLARAISAHAAELGIAAKHEPR